jgi:hypothetical protein
LIERVVLASSNKNDLVVDPFAGSGTTLRVCQHLDRQSTGIELSSEYVSLIETRLKEPFTGFDSIDPRMKRIPNDLNDPTVRAEYFEKHRFWFLSHHKDEQETFRSDFASKYPDKASGGQPTLFPDEPEPDAAPDRGDP